MASAFTIPATAPSSPATTRRGLPPVTPQRFPRAKQHIRSPLTPASSTSTPFTPLSLHSFGSSSGGSSPASVASLRKHTASLSLTPEIGLGHKNKDKSLADIAKNWRSRANENGIRVASMEDSQYTADDEASECAYSETGSVHDEALLPPPFLSSQHRPRAQSYAPLPPRQNIAMSPQSNAAPHTPARLSLSPQVLRTPARRTLVTNTLNLNINTPPQKPNAVKDLKLKGSLTDPAHTRRRPAFGQTTTDLFDIDENEYAPYPQSFASPTARQELPLSLYDPFDAPFPALSTITESDFHSLHTQSQFQSPVQPQVSNYNYQYSPQYSPAPKPKPSPTPEPSSCSVCGRTVPSLAILSPCTHPLCSACLTSALNIVGEKDMECAVCKTGVADFHLRSVSGPTNPAGNPFAPSEDRDDPRLLPSIFESGGIGLGLGNITNQFKFFDLARDTSTPVPSPLASKPGENIVLRIDNVPWDITPPAISAWLRQPVQLVHVLLDRKGKTLSHAFVEVTSEEVAKAALRGAQNSVLGKGKRARGVTVTRSGQEELMRALFPSWQGNFDGSKPSLSGLDHEKVIKTLETGLITETEFDALLRLIRSPDSHFLKVPELPFHSLISILAKFPADIDSRVFWSGALRDMLYDVTFAAIQVLLSRIHGPAGSGDSEILTQLFHTAMKCPAFTSQQTQHLAQHCAVPSRESPVGALAREFGVDTELVEALAQRLSGMR